MSIECGGCDTLKYSRNKMIDILNVCKNNHDLCLWCLKTVCDNSRACRDIQTESVGAVYSTYEADTEYIQKKKSEKRGGEGHNRPPRREIAQKKLTHAVGTGTGLAFTLSREMPQIYEPYIGLCKYTFLLFSRDPHHLRMTDYMLNKLETECDTAEGNLTSERMRPPAETHPVDYVKIKMEKKGGDVCVSSPNSRSNGVDGNSFDNTMLLCGSIDMNGFVLGAMGNKRSCYVMDKYTIQCDAQIQNNARTIVHINARSVAKGSNKDHTFDQILRANNVDIFGITEHKQRMLPEVPEYENYNRWAKCRPKTRGGGIALYVKRSIKAWKLQVSEWPTQMEDESVWVLIDCKGPKNCHWTSIYTGEKLGHTTDRQGTSRIWH